MAVEHATHISSLYDEFHVVPQLQFALGFGLRIVEEYLLHNVGTLNEAKVFLHGAHHAVVLDWVRGILEAYVAGTQGTSARDNAVT